MRKRSSRIFFKGLDHNEIVINGKYHDKAIAYDKDLNRTVLWEKLGSGIDDFTEDFYWNLDGNESTFYCYSKTSNLAQYTGGGCAWGKNDVFFGASFENADFIIWSEDEFTATFQYATTRLLPQECGTYEVSEKTYNSYDSSYYAGCYYRWSLTFSDDNNHKVHIRYKKDTVLKRLVLVGESNATQLNGAIPKMNEVQTYIDYNEWAGMTSAKQSEWASLCRTYLVHPPLQFCCPKVRYVSGELFANNKTIKSLRYLFMGSGLLMFDGTILKDLSELEDVSGMFWNCLDLENVISAFQFNSKLFKISNAFYSCKKLNSINDILGIPILNNIQYATGVFAESGIEGTISIANAVKNLIGDCSYYHSQLGNVKNARLYMRAYTSGGRTTRTFFTHQYAYESNNNLNMLEDNYYANDVRMYEPKGIYRMYYRCFGITDGNKILADHFRATDIQESNTDDLVMRYAFDWCYNLKHIPALWNETFNNYKLDGSGAFYRCNSADNFSSVPAYWRL